ncbi:helix-turn-helix domain-containing protein [Paenibacillus sp. IHBB 10380]|uniref:helix-turn-helix domain-containing protein n=1 Tax=Paenibacillus sp. IHBB 10380 TaxID=1566358 RepID=UPI000697D632|nr:helix-turn-helix domain-containing protein [Paenibacillus sp. IHBB 10380]
MTEIIGPNKQEAIFYSLIHIEMVNLSEHSKSNRTVFQEHTLIIVTEGQGRVVLEGDDFPLEKGVGFILEPGMMNGIESSIECGMSYYQITFEMISRDGERFSTLTDLKRGLLRSGPVSFQPFSQCILLLDSLYQNRNYNEGLEAFANHTRFQELLLLILRSNPAVNLDKDCKAAVQRSIDYVKEHYQDTLTVNQLSEIADISRSRYSQLFKEITGQIPLEYLNGIRIDRAQQLLLLTDDRLYDIAQAIGYSNEYYFNRRFKGTVGITPGQYRRTHQENIRVFAPFLEDYLLALGITPVVQYSNPLWGKQDYLGLDQVPEFDISSRNWKDLLGHKPELIMLDDGFQRWNLEECRQIAPLFKLPSRGEDWRSTLRSVAAIFGRLDSVGEIIASYEHQAEEAKRTLSRTVHRQTVAFLRISAYGIRLYGGEELGYTGGVLYRDLGLKPDSLVQQLTHGKRYVNLTSEFLPHLNADHLFVTFDKWEGEGREVLDTLLWKTLPAVQNRCVYEVDFLAWMNYGVLSHSRKIEDVLRVLA